MTKAAVVPRQLRSPRGQGEGWQQAAGSLPAAQAASQRGLQGRGTFQQTPGEPPPVRAVPHVVLGHVESVACSSSGQQQLCSRTGEENAGEPQGQRNQRRSP